VIQRSAPSTIATLLRLAPEPCVYLDDLQVHRLLIDHLPDVVARLEAALRLVGSPPTLESPYGLKKVYRLGDTPGDFRIMAYADAATMSVKLIGTNEASTVVPDKISVGKLAVVHPVDHHIMALLDACVLSSLRTALGIAVAFRASGLSAPRRLGIVGGGRVGIYTALAFQRLGLADEVTLSDVSPQRLRDAAAVLAIEHGPTVMFAPAETILNRCDTVVLATTARTPILGGPDLNGRPIRFLASVGADADNLSELHPDVICRVRLVIGSPLCLGLGDLRRWAADDLLPATACYLHDLVSGRSQVGGSGPICYVSTGFPLLDHVAALAAVEASGTALPPVPATFHAFA
jgi:ornithine cyclodeaminase/alanine dehydrogenase-like protein (mu-crystallin family)